MKRVLMIAFHYPPMSGSSGVQRTLKYSKYLKNEGWEPLVLTPHPRVHPNVSQDQLKDIPDCVKVVRSAGFDTAKHLSLKGAYPGFLAWPDRWASWWLSAVPTGLKLIKKYDVDMIWSTYPIATAHLIALTLNKITGVPWVADFRDPMVEADYPSDPRVNKIFRWIENHTVNKAAAVVVTTKGTARIYKERYPDIADSHWHCISNGFDEENFQLAEKQFEDQCQNLDGIHCENQDESPLENQKIAKPRLTFLHSGLLYPSERDPRPFYSALAELKKEGVINRDTIKIVLRASGHEELHGSYIKENDIADIVTLETGVPYIDALMEMLSVDGLLLFQASNCNDQIPAKLYEYLRAGKPLFAMTDDKGDTAQLLKGLGISSIAQIDSKTDIKEKLCRYIGSIRSGSIAKIDKSEIKQFSRQEQSKQLADIFNTVSSKAVQ